LRKIFTTFCKTIFAFVLITALKVTAQPPSKTLHKKEQKKVNIHSPVKHRLKYVIINNSETGFGYNIVEGNHIMIHQPSVPGLQGNKGFTTGEDAAKVALLAINKIHKNIMPPTITRRELDSLHIRL
jgi:hypothetical protein